MAALAQRPQGQVKGTPQIFAQPIATSTTTKGGFRPGTGSSFPAQASAGQAQPAGGWSGVYQLPPAVGPVGGGGGNPFGGGAPAASSSSISLKSEANPYLTDIGEFTGQQMRQDDPLLTEAINNYRERMSTDTTKRATVQAQGAADDSFNATTQAIAERAALGGTLGSGQQESQITSASDKNERNKAAAAASIQNAELERKDRLALAGPAVFGSQDARKQNWAAQAGSNAQATAGNQIQAQTLQLQAQQAAAQAQAAQLNAMMQLWNMGGTTGVAPAAPPPPAAPPAVFASSQPRSGRAGFGPRR